MIRKRQLCSLVAFAAGAMLGTASSAAPVDLSTWFKEGGSSTWNLAADNNSVVQAVNGNPAAFVNGENSQGKKLSGTIEVQTTNDDDFIGFVLGYNAGDFTDPMAEYILIDWKQGTQSSYGCDGTAGLAVSRVSGVLGDNSGAWCHDPANNVTELQRAATLGATGWEDNTEYMFHLTFTANKIEVLVNGVEELSIMGTFGDGSFGFYNYSQDSVRYAGLQEDVIPDPNEVPVPLSLPLLGGGLAMHGFLRHRRARG